MKVPFVFGPNDLRLCNIEVPHAGSRDVVLRVGFVGICGSDLGYVTVGGIGGPTKDPVPLGHELSGTVIEAGSDVASVSVGDRVVVNPLVNMIGNGGQEGGFAERLLIRDVAGKPQSLLRLPDSLSMDVGALIEPLAVAAHAVNRLGVTTSDKVAVFGAGPIGLACIVVLHHRGVEDIAVFDLSPFRRARAEKLGASWAIDPQLESPVDALKRVHGTVPVFRTEAPKTNYFLEASGAPVIPDILRFARARASICVVSNQKKPVEVDFQSVMAKEITFTGALGYPTEFSEVLNMLDVGGIDLEAMISHRFQGADFMTAFETAKRPNHAAKVLVQYNA